MRLFPFSTLNEVVEVHDDREEPVAHVGQLRVLSDSFCRFLSGANGDQSLLPEIRREVEHTRDVRVRWFAGEIVCKTVSNLVDCR